MSRKTIFATALLTIALTAAPVLRMHGQKKFTLDKVVAVVGNTVILYSEVEEMGERVTEFKRERGYTSDRNPRIEALEELLVQKLLYNQALIDSVEINKPYAAEQADEHLTQLVARSGSVSQLEAQFHRPIFEIRRELERRYEEQLYAQNMRGELLNKINITPGEVERFFNSMSGDSLPIIPIQYVFGQITKLPLSTDEAKRRAREQALGIRERIVNGTRFDVLARMYSEDDSSVRGGELTPMPLESFVEPFSRALEKLRPGQISEVVETMFGFHIIELLGRQGNLYSARHILIRPKFTDQEMAETLHSLDSVAVAIRADSITFEKAAFKFSDDKYSKLNGGLASNLELMESLMATDASYATTKHFKEDLSPDDFKALEKLKPGEISDAFASEDLRGDKLGKIVKLIEIIPAHPANLEEDYLRLESAAINEKRNRVLEEWIDNKIKSMFVRIDQDFHIPEEFNNPNWLK